MSSARQAEFQTKEHFVVHYKFSDGNEYIEIKSLVTEEAIVLSKDEFEAIARYLTNTTGIDLGG